VPHRRTRRLRAPHRGVPRWVIRTCGVYGIAASLSLLAIAALRDGTAWTYVAGLFYWWWLIPAPFALVLAVTARSWRVGAVLLLPAVTSGHLLAPYVGNALQQAAGRPESWDLRVATFNLTNGRPVDGLLELVQEHAPQILLLQEVTATRDDLAALLPGYDFAAVGLGVHGPGHDGYAVLSQFPITSVKRVEDLPTGARPTDVVTVDVEGRPVHVLSVHLASPCIGCPDSGENLAGGTADAARVRVAEALRYAQLLRPLLERDEPVILGGDLNSSPLNEPWEELTRVGLVDAQAAVGTGPGLTRGPGPGVARVDFVLVSGLTPVDVEQGARGESSHSPVIADLAWPEPSLG
jgi:vancomycin resistance protein VanJ